MIKTILNMVNILLCITIFFACSKTELSINSTAKQGITTPIIKTATNSAITFTTPNTPSYLSSFLIPEKNIGPGGVEWCQSSLTGNWGPTGLNGGAGKNFICPNDGKAHEPSAIVAPDIYSKIPRDFSYCNKCNRPIYRNNGEEKWYDQYPNKKPFNGQYANKNRFKKVEQKPCNIDYDISKYLD